jgi:hypothetical protein
MFVRHADSVAYRDLSGEGGAVLLRLDTGQYHGIDPVGRLVWELIGDGTTLDDLLHRLRSEVEDTPDTMDSEIEQFLLELVERGLVEIEDHR